MQADQFPVRHRIAVYSAVSVVSLALSFAVPVVPAPIQTLLSPTMLVPASSPIATLELPSTQLKSASSPTAVFAPKQTPGGFGQPMKMKPCCWNSIPAYRSKKLHSCEDGELSVWQFVCAN